MKRICRICQTQYDGDPGSTLCPDCVSEQKKTTVRIRVCRACGTTFPGGPRAWYCPDCRAERKRQQQLDYAKRASSGNVRHIGSVDICIRCGESYEVSSGNQRYCPSCAPIAWAEADRAQALEYYNAHADPDARRQQRAAHTSEICCAVCGKPFVPTSPSITCSAACSDRLAKINSATWEKAHRQERTKYHRERRRQIKKEESQ